MSCLPCSKSGDRMSLNWCVVDFESWGVPDLTKVGAWAYAEHPLTRPLCLGYYVNGWTPGEVQVWHPGEDISELKTMAEDTNLTWIAFNVAFERAMWKHHMVESWGFPEIPITRWHDIQATAAMKGLPQNLDDLLAVLRLPAKDMEGSDFTKALSKPDKKGEYIEITPDVQRRIDEYVVKDVGDEVAAHKILGFLPRGERLDWLLTQKTNEWGVQLDLDYIRACQAVVDKTLPPLIQEFQDITGGLKPSQGAKFLAWLEQNGFEAPIGDTGNPSLGREALKRLIGSAILEDEDDESQVAPADRIGRAVADNVLRSLRIRQLVGASSIGKLARMEGCVSSDGRSRGLLHWHGTGPGRAAGRLWQPHNLPKPTIKAADGEPLAPQAMVKAIMTGDPAIVQERLGPPVQAVVSGIRHAIVAAKGRTFMSGDYAGIQARLVLALAGQDDKTAMMAAGQDVYIDMAQQIFSREIDKHKDPWERGIGKNSVLGLGFQLGPSTFQTKYVQTHPVLFDKADILVFCNGVVQTYRKKWAPKVPYVWYALQEAAEEAVFTGKPQMAYGIIYAIADRDWLTATIPSGGKIWYYKPTKYYNAKFERDAIRCLTLEGGRLVTDTAMFGGRLTENAIMRMEHDIMTVAKAKCEANGLPVCLEVHDEILVEPLTADADVDAFKQIMLDIPEWAKDLRVPINIDTWVGDRYRKG